MLAIVLTLAALVVVAWLAIRAAIPYPGQSRVVVSGRQPAAPPPGRSEPLFVGVDKRTGDVTVVARDEQGQMSRLILPHDALQQPSELTAPAPSEKGPPGNQAAAEH